jgi:hypothetical protein
LPWSVIRYKIGPCPNISIRKGKLYPKGKLWINRGTASVLAQTLLGLSDIANHLN